MKWLEIAAAIGVASAILVVGCGPDIELQTAATTATGSSGEGGAGGAAAGGAGGTGGNGLACTKLLVQPTVIAMTALAQAAPRIAIDKSTGHVVYTFQNGSSGPASSLYAMTVNAFDAWPPTWTPALIVDTNLQSYTMGDGPMGPVGIVRHVNAPPRLIDSFVPQVHFVDTPVTDEGDPLFVTAIANRFFWGATFNAGAYDALHLGSYQPGSIPQSEQPLVCVKPRLRAYAQPSNAGFLAAMLEPNPSDPSCDPANPRPPTIVSISRYDSSDVPGSSLTSTQGWWFVFGEPVVNLGLAGTTDGGAWVVYQTDGSTAEFPPPIMAARAMPNGIVVGDGASDPLTNTGILAPALATSTLGDTLAVAWIDAIDPSAPVIRVQLHDIGQAMDPATSIPTNDAWYGGDLQLLGSTDKRSLLVAWTSKNITAFARVDCVP